MISSLFNCSLYFGYEYWRLIKMQTYCLSW
nr:MAG TPA: hypothetical protein [Bacteriophage sp.]